MHGKCNLILFLWSLLHVSYHIRFSWRTHSFDFLLDILFLASYHLLSSLRFPEWTISLLLSWAWNKHGKRVTESVGLQQNFSCMMLLSVTCCKTALKPLTEDYSSGGMQSLLILVSFSSFIFFPVKASRRKVVKNKITRVLHSVQIIPQNHVKRCVWKNKSDLFWAKIPN